MVVTYLVPGSLLFIPMFQVIYSLGLIDNIVGLMVTYLTFTVPFATWMMIGYFRNVSATEPATLVCAFLAGAEDKTLSTMLPEPSR